MKNCIPSAAQKLLGSYERKTILVKYLNIKNIYKEKETKTKHETWKKIINKSIHT